MSTQRATELNRTLGTLEGAMSSVLHLNEALLNRGDGSTSSVANSIEESLLLRRDLLNQLQMGLHDFSESDTVEESEDDEEEDEEGFSHSPAAPYIIGDLRCARAGNKEAGTTVCCICQDEAHYGEKLAVLHCDHWFCYPCITSWLRQCGNCPVCRREVSYMDTQTAFDEKQAEMKRREEIEQRQKEIVLSTEVASLLRPRTAGSLDKKHVCHRTGESLNGVKINSRHRDQPRTSSTETQRPPISNRISLQDVPNRVPLPSTLRVPSVGGSASLLLRQRRPTTGLQARMQAGRSVSQTNKSQDHNRIESRTSPQHPVPRASFTVGWGGSANGQPLRPSSSQSHTRIQRTQSAAPSTRQPRNEPITRYQSITSPSQGTSNRLLVRGSSKPAQRSRF